MSTRPVACMSDGFVVLARWGMGVRLQSTTTQSSGICSDVYMVLRRISSHCYLFVEKLVRTRYTRERPRAWKRRVGLGLGYDESDNACKK